MLVKNNLPGEKCDIIYLPENIIETETIILTSIDLNGKPRSRPLPISKIIDNEIIWLFSNEFSGKKNEISENPLVCLSYSNPSSQLFLSIMGQAFINDSPQKMFSLWQPSLINWFPKSLDTPNLSLLKIIIEEIHW